MNLPGFSLFISDLHLCENRPEITQQFIAFLETSATKAENLYILGDLFEYWPGDDEMDNSQHQTVINALKILGLSNTKIYLMHGNRDFLISNAFTTNTHTTLLTDPTILNLYGKRILLSHGDQLCTDDTSYQAFRTK